VIISAYQTEKVSDDHPYIWRYTARRALVIFDHPYNADYLLARVEPILGPYARRSSRSV